MEPSRKGPAHACRVVTSTAPAFFALDRARRCRDRSAPRRVIEL